MIRGLTDYQWIILWEIDDQPGRLWRRDEDWFTTGTHRDHKITFQVNFLLRRELIELTPDGEDLVKVTEAGKRMLAGRDYMVVLNRWNLRSPA